MTQGTDKLQDLCRRAADVIRESEVLVIGAGAGMGGAAGGGGLAAAKFGAAAATGGAATGCAGGAAGSPATSRS